MAVVRPKSADQTPQSHARREVARRPELRKFRWLDRIACDVDLAPVVFRVAYLIRCTYGDNETGRCEAGMDTIARRLGVNEKTIRRAVEQLEKQGYLSVTRRGWNHTHILRPTLPERTNMSAPEEGMERTEMSTPESDVDRTNLSSWSGHWRGQECPRFPPIPADPARGGPEGRPPEALSSTSGEESSSTFEVSAERDALPSVASPPALEEEYWNAIQEEDGDYTYRGNDDEEDDDFDAVS